MGTILEKTTNMTLLNNGVYRIFLCNAQMFSVKYDVGLFYNIYWLFLKSNIWLNIPLSEKRINNSYEYLLKLLDTEVFVAASINEKRYIPIWFLLRRRTGDCCKAIVHICIFKKKSDWTDRLCTNISTYTKYLYDTESMLH